MSPDDEREDDLDDLAALAGGLSAPATVELPSDTDEEADLGALAAVGGQRREVAQATEPQARRAATQPTVPASRPRSGWLMPLLAGAGVTIGVAGVLFGLSARREVSTVVPQEAPAEAPAETTPSTDIAAPPRSLVAAAPADPPAQPALAQAPAQAKKSADRVTPHSATASDQPVEEATQPASELEEPEEQINEVTGEQSAAKASPSQMDSLLDEALAPRAQRDPGRARREAALQQDTLPATPSREDLTKAMTVLLPAIRGCAMGQSGLATAAIVVRADGRVAGVEVAGAPFSGTASGRCMEGVIRRAQFPKFTQPIFRIRFPFAIQ